MDFQDDIHIGHPGDALALLDQIFEEKKFDKDVEKILNAIRDAIERGII